MKPALLIVSFGTSVPGAAQSIRAVEQVLAGAAPDRDVFRAYTSPTIRRILGQRGEKVPSPEEAITGLLEDGYQELILQPTHLLPGIEYDRLCRTARRFAPQFSRLTVGSPLISGIDDLKTLARCVLEAWQPEQGALVLMGHGTNHFANMAYPALQTVLRSMGADRAFVGTVEGWPGLDDVIAQLKPSGLRDVLLAPFMLVAGDHALNDMAGPDPDSWKSRLEAEGFAVQCHLEGLGMLPGVQALYRQHLEKLLS